MRWLRTAFAAVLGITPWVGVAAENIDPQNIDDQYAWAENVGWLNAEPSGNGGPGVQVADFELTGWMWGENIGWVSLSCKNEEHGAPSCDHVSYGVKNDGTGVLSGYAWGENVGWVSFAPSTAGVFINPSSGDFHGHAWGENTGWISFASDAPNPFVLTTGWNCEPPPPVPVDSPTLSLEDSGVDTVLTWTPVAGATGYDVVFGSLSELSSPGGGFVSATKACPGENLTDPSITHPQLPGSGEGFWYLVRGVNCGGTGSYDTGEPSQVASRDGDVAASQNDCAVP